MVFFVLECCLSCNKVSLLQTNKTITSEVEKFTLFMLSRVKSCLEKLYHS